MPSPIETIVAATDFSFAAHRATRRAGMLAKQRGASLQLLHVIDADWTKPLLRSLAASDLDERLHIEANHALDSLADDVMKSCGASTTQVLREGRVVPEILGAAAQADLIVLGPRGLNPVRDFVLGTMAERVARQIQCPMLVAKQDPQIAYQHVLVPVDFSTYSAAAVQFAAALAPDATLHVFHAIDGPLEGALRTAGVSADVLSAYHEQVLREANTSLTELTAGVSNHMVKIAQPGDARVLIVKRAAEHQCTLIVMGKQGRSWLGEQLLGSVTRLVLERAACDVVVVPQK